MSSEQACNAFRSIGARAATLHAAQNLNISFSDLKRKVGQGEGLSAAIHTLRPEVEHRPRSGAPRREAGMAASREANSPKRVAGACRTPRQRAFTLRPSSPWRSITPAISITTMLPTPEEAILPTMLLPATVVPPAPSTFRISAPAPPPTTPAMVLPRPPRLRFLNTVPTFAANRARHRLMIHSITFPF